MKRNLLLILIKRIILFILFFVSQISNAQISTESKWIWISGDSVINQCGSYGQRNVASDNNKPGERQQAVTWVDLSGNLWLFGGFGCAGDKSGWLNDLWKFDPIENRWTWIWGDSSISYSAFYGKQGTASASNRPRARSGAVSWIDASGNFWLFGGAYRVLDGTNNTPTYGLNDLWEYTPSTNQWTWVKGDSTFNQEGLYGSPGIPADDNKPGARSHATSWKDSDGNLWLFGGLSYGLPYYRNDLWKYTPSTNQWTWINGDSAPPNDAVFGIKGTPAISDKPGGSAYLASWTDLEGNLWLFGGRGSGWLNLLWKYNPSSKQWTWISGDSLQDVSGFYGIQGTPDKNNQPGGRELCGSGTDTKGYLWLFGGDANNIINGFGYLNDLWKFSPSANQWTWVKGDSTINNKGVYGRKGFASSQNHPGARSGSCSWEDKNGNFWLYGGEGYSSNQFGYGLSDLWVIGSQYTFIGDGNWDIESNWLNNQKPPDPIGAGTEVIIDPEGQCLRTSDLKVQFGGSITIQPDKELTLQNANLVNAGNINGTGNLVLSGGNPGTFSSSGSITTPVILDNKKIYLVGNANINSLSLTRRSFIILNSFNLNIGSGTLLADSANFIITNDSGSLTRNSPLPLYFPIGPDSSNFTPVTIYDAGSGRVLQRPLTEIAYSFNSNFTKSVPAGSVYLKWSGTESPISANKIKIKAEWDSKNQPLFGFDPKHCYISLYAKCNPPPNCKDGYYDASAFSQAAGNGHPYTLSRDSVGEFISFIVTSKNYVPRFTDSTRNGKWEDPYNWTPGIVGDTLIREGTEIIIDPFGGQCIIHGNLNVQKGGTLTVHSGVLIVYGKLNSQSQSDIVIEPGAKIEIRKP